MDGLIAAYLFAFAVINGVHQIDAGTPDPKYRKNLLENYDPMAQPFSTAFGLTTTVTMTSLNVIHYNIDDKEQTMEIHAWLYMSWIDERLRWTQYQRDTGGYLHFKKSEIWRPDISLYNTAKPKTMDEFADEAHILVKGNGSIIWIPPIRFISNCKMNLLHWPFDTQSCYIKLGSWTFSELEIDLQLGPEGSQVQIMAFEGHFFANNTEWIIEEATATRTSRKYPCCDENYVDVTYHFKLARKYSTYAFTVIFPVIMISFIGVINFLLPAKNNTRITVAGFNFLSIAAYLIYFRFRLPTIDHVPNIVKLFVWDLFITTINLILTICLTLLTNWNGGKRKKEAPHWAKSILNSGFGSVLFLGQTSDSEKRQCEASGNHNKNTNIESTFDRALSNANDWGLVADLIDRFVFLLLAFLTIVMMICHLC